MTGLKRVKFLGVVCLLATQTILGLHSLHAQKRSIRFQHLTTEDGLAQNMVDCMLQDRQGFVWIGTWNGLCRYDGYSLEVFSKESSPASSLGNNFIYALYEDRFGNLWIGTADGVYSYIYDKGTFTQVVLDGSEKNAITSIAAFNDSTILMGSKAGVLKVQVLNELGESRLVDAYPFAPEVLHGSRVNTLYTDPGSHIWVGTDEGVNVITPSGVEHLKTAPANTNSISSNHVLKIYQSGSGEFWIGTEFGLNQYNPGTGEIRRFFHNPSNRRSLLHNTVMDIIEDHRGDLFIATLGGLSILSAGEAGFLNHRNELNSEYDLNNEFINCMMRDSRNNIWIGTERGGINFYNINQNTFEHFESEVGNSNSLNNSTINSIYEDATNIWIGTAGGGLNRYIKKTKTYVHYTFDPNDERSLSSNFVTSIFPDEVGNLWIGTWGSGLNKLSDLKNGHFIHCQDQNTGLVSNFVSSVAQSEDGTIWVGTIGGLSRLTPGRNSFETVSFGFDGPEVSGVGCLTFDQEGNLWVGTRTGLFLIPKASGDDPAPSSIREFRHDSNDPNSISGNYVISALEDSEGHMWFGTYGQGINRFSGAGDSLKFERFTTAHGLSNNIVYGMQEDDTGNLWLSTDYGLSRLNIKDGKIRNFYISDGLLNNQYYWSAAYKNSHGKLYFGGMNGLDTFYPEWINDEIIQPDVVLTDLKLLNESVIPGQEYNGVAVLQKNISKADVVTLSYKEKMFAIEFSSFNYQEPGLIRYAYFLEGFDDHWNYVASNRRYASYTNLKPGKYTFKVRASASNGEFTSPPALVKIYIAPPFWDTWWFRTFVALAFAAVIFGYIRLRTYALKRQKQILEKQVKERTERINQQKEALSVQAVQLRNNNRELEQKKELIEGQNQRLEVQNKEILDQRDQLIELNKKLKLVSQLRLSFFTNISHEFRTPLTLIIGPLEKLLKENKVGDEVQNTLSLINRNARRLLYLINQIMDFRKIEQGRMELKVTRGNFRDFCKNVFLAFEPLSEIKQISFSFRTHSMPAEVWFDVQKLENVLYNLLSNAFKYTPAGGCIRLDVNGLTFDESRLNPEATEVAGDKTVISIRVTDSGLGISEENIPLIFKRFYRIHSEEALKVGGSGIGLALTKELIRTHHGEIYVSSQLGEGSVFEVQFPCLRGSYGSGELTEYESDVPNIQHQVEVLKNELLDHTKETADQGNGHAFDKNKHTVLVAEDNLDLRKFMILRLQNTYNVLEAQDGEAGIQLAEKHNPDIIISDIMMPKVDGLELCASIKNNLVTSHIPVILLTAKSSVENQIEGLEIGADDYLPKPFNFELLEARIQNLVESRRKLRLLFTGSAIIDSRQLAANAKDQKFLDHAIRTVEEHMEASDFGVKEFVKLMGISRSLLHKKLTALTDHSAADFINQLRMRKAMELLKQNDLNISEVAYSVGYNDPKYFSRLFSRHYGRSPKEFLQSPVAFS